MQELGERIRQLRVAHGMSQTALGDGRYSGSYISHIESGRRRPGSEVLGFIAARLGLAVAELDPDDPESADADVVALLAGVRRSLAAKQWDAAVRSARQASLLAAELHRDSRCWEADFLLASALMASGRYEEAGELAVDLASRSVGQAPTTCGPRLGPSRPGPIVLAAISPTPSIRRGSRWPMRASGRCSPRG